MIYSEDFKTRVLEEFPENAEIITMLDNGDSALLLILRDMAYNSIHLETLFAIEAFKELQILAGFIQRRIHLYDECCQQLSTAE